LESAKNLVRCKTKPEWTLGPKIYIIAKKYRIRRNQEAKSYFRRLGSAQR
jgi:hypothetical protein